MTAVRTALGPYVGPTVADTCVRATAISVGKTAADLGPADMPALEASVRRLLQPVAPQSVIDSILVALRSSVSGEVAA
jgi:hypothetical protein